MDGHLSGKAQAAGLHGLVTQPAHLAEVPGRHVDGVQFSQGGGVDHPRPRIEERLPAGLGAQFDGQVEAPEDQPGNGRRHLTDVSRVLESERRLDEGKQRRAVPEHAMRARESGAGPHFGDHVGIRLRPSFEDGRVPLTLAGVRLVYAHDDVRPATTMPGGVPRGCGGRGTILVSGSRVPHLRQESDRRRSRLLFPLRRNRILQIDADGVGPGCQGLVVAVRAVSRHEQDRAPARAHISVSGRRRCSRGMLPRCRRPPVQSPPPVLKTTAAYPAHASPHG